jgi:uncharacterized protein YndB with AHSA1/START domain
VTGRSMSSNPPRAHVKRVIRAPAAEIFEAWTNPSAMAQWMTPSGTATAEVDLRVGGRFRLVMADEHLRIEHTGEYRVIQPPVLLIFSWRSEFTGMQDTLVTVRLTEKSSRETEIEVMHEFTTDGEAISHTGGWNQLLTRLQALLEDVCRST